MKFMRLRFTHLLTIAIALAAPRALAQGGNTAAAEALFQEGRSLFQAGKFAEACPKLAESQRLDPATGTLLTLALCHESEGKLATAWAEFSDVEGRAQREGRDDRVKIAREHTTALRPRLSTLAVDVSPEAAQTPGLELRVDGVALGSGSFGVAVPVDGGEHKVEASAPGKAPWQGTVAVKPESDAVRVAVPALADAPGGAPPPAAAAATAAPPPAEASTDSDSGSGMRIAGLVTAGAGVVLLGVGTYLAVDAKGDYDAAKDECTGGVCPPGPYAASEDARSQGNVATYVSIIGGAALVTGAALFVFNLGSSGSEAPPAAGLRVDRVGVGPGSVTLAGRF
jgi:serine/threonine-protein kinase